MNKTLTIDYYSDLLCVWALVAQTRIDKLKTSFGDKIIINYRYMDVFGDTTNKMKYQWSERGCYQGFATHVNAIANKNNLKVNQNLWTIVKPSTSANVHLILKAITCAFSADKCSEMDFLFRKAFFENGQDISNFSVLFEISKSHGLDCQSIKYYLNNGAAMAKLMMDYQQSKIQLLQGSPSYVIDNGRQILYGDVSYEILQANVIPHISNV